MVSTHDKLCVVQAFEYALCHKQKLPPHLSSDEGQQLFNSLLSADSPIAMLHRFSGEMLWAVNVFDLEVKNGGFSQFLCNSSGVYAPVIVSILRLLDCPKTISITAAALAARPDGWETLDSRSLSQYLHQFDLEYYQTGEDLFDKMYDFIAAHPNGFRLP